MKKVLMSIHPKWCEKIFNGQKTIEVRRTSPKQLETPFEVVVYQTKIRFKVRAWQENFQSMVFTPNGGAEDGNGKVIGSFVCDKVYKIVPDGEYYSNGYDIDDDMLSEMCLGRGYLTGYGLGYTIYGWHITSPKLFDKPRELSEFGIARPPQSWCYVEQAP
jgi:predicted transcriptional regulator